MTAEDGFDRVLHRRQLVEVYHHMFLRCLSRQPPALPLRASDICFGHTFVHSCVHAHVRDLFRAMPDRLGAQAAITLHGWHASARIAGHVSAGEDITCALYHILLAGVCVCCVRRPPCRYSRLHLCLSRRVPVATSDVQHLMCECMSKCDCLGSCV